MGKNILKRDAQENKGMVAEWQNKGKKKCNEAAVAYADGGRSRPLCGGCFWATMGPSLAQVTKRCAVCVRVVCEEERIEGWRIDEGSERTE